MNITPQAPTPGDIHLWLLDLSLDGDQLASLRDQLSNEEQKRADRLLLPAVRRQFIIARGMMRRILAAYLSAHPRKLAFSYGPHGKPSLSPPHDNRFQFNLSHSGDLAILAVNLELPIGVDIERTKPERDFLKLAERFFSAVERSKLRHLPQDHVMDAFYACWTRKEAYLKAIGTGLATPLHAFDVTLAPGDLPALAGHRISPDEPERWRLLEISVPDGYRAAVATGWDSPRLTMYR